MSKMAELDLGIRDMLDEGYNPVSISVRLGIPLYFVYDILEYEKDMEELSPFNTVNS
jgi:hypothetical protein